MEDTVLGTLATVLEVCCKVPETVTLTQGFYWEVLWWVGFMVGVCDSVSNSLTNLSLQAPHFFSCSFELDCPTQAVVGTPWCLHK